MRRGERLVSFSKSVGEEKGTLDPGWDAWEAEGRAESSGEETERRMPDGGFSESVVLRRYPVRELDQQGRNGKMIPGTSSVFGGKECQTRATNIGGYFYFFGKRVDGKETRSSKFGLFIRSR